ncbi:tetratricopeptide repeat protein [Undibacterium sp. Ji50W]|uniref:tetratricopeptide repeat protein n=1 Tax=Undibacterium sp. Ji50W TaxID=3413041 RepID=UPI003BF3BDD2
MSVTPQIKVYQDDITPFLQRLPAFLLFPFRPAPLFMMAGLSAVSAVTVFTSGLFRGVLMLFFLRYAYAVMEMAAMGKLDPKWDDITVFGNKDKRPYKQNLVFLLYFVLVFITASYAIRVDTPKEAPAVSAGAASLAAPSTTSRASTSPGQTEQRRNAQDDEDDDAETPRATGQYDMNATKADDATSRKIAMQEQALTYGTANTVAEEAPRDIPGRKWDRFLDRDVHFAKWFYVLALLFAIPIPAAVMVLALEDDTLRALNPLTSLFFIRAMGMSYFIVWALFGLAMLTIASVRHLLPAGLSPFASIPLVTFINFYLILATYSMMGYVLYQYHQQLGMAVEVDFDAQRTHEEASAAPVSSDPFMQRIDALLLKGEVDAAIRLLEDEMRYDRNNLGMNERLYQLLQRKDDEKRILDQGRRYMLALSKATYHEKALHLLENLKQRDPAFDIQADNVLQMAGTAFAARDFKGAMTLIQGFDKKYPGHADIPAVYMLAARLSGDHFRKYAQAISILNVILQRHPDAAVAKDAASYLETMQKAMAAQAAATSTAAATATATATATASAPSSKAS